jgi:hypothetical protein
VLGVRLERRPRITPVTLTHEPSRRTHPRSRRIYGGVDADHLPASGAEYDLLITRGAKQDYPWVPQWDQDEGGASCFHSNISEAHTQRSQTVHWEIVL